MPTITIITTTATFGVAGDRWTRDETGDVYVYSDAQDDPVATVDAAQFVAALRTEGAVDDTDTLADIEPGLNAEVERAVRDALTNPDVPITHTTQ